jgi:hypothetical protein
MQRPFRWRGCPPGLEYLHELDHIEAYVSNNFSGLKNENSYFFVPSRFFFNPNFLQSDTIRMDMGVIGVTFRIVNKANEQIYIALKRI